MEEIFPVFWPYYAMALALATLLGAVAQRSRFCLQGGLRDLVNLGQSQRIMTYVAAMAFAMLATTVVESLSLVNVDVTKPAYRGSEFLWGRYVLGGFLFGYGMVLSHGCGFRQVVKSGEGNLKALWVLSVMAVTIYLMTRGEFFGSTLLPLFAPLTISLNSHQDLGSILLNEQANTLRLGIAFIFSAFVSYKLIQQKSSLGRWFTTLFIGSAIALGFVLTGGEYAQLLAEEAQFMSTPPAGLGGQSFTVAAPLGDMVYFLSQWSFPSLTFGVLAVSGLLLGSFLSAIMGKRFTVSGFDSRKDMVVASVGGSLAGVGAVIALGCSVGHGLTGIATLSLGSMLSFAAIVAGGLLAIRQTAR
ncbi:MAG TPA: YeeE/YedE family protein [Pseudomonadales bacterium]|nr:YeeE/YedE family protein [Pseudomonadales bacterium]